MSLQESVERLVCCRREQLSRTNSVQSVVVLYSMNRNDRPWEEWHIRVGGGAGAPAYPSTGSHTSQQSVLLKNSLLVKPLFLLQIDGSKTVGGTRTPTSQKKNFYRVVDWGSFSISLMKLLLFHSIMSRCLNRKVSSVILRACELTAV